MITVKEVKKVAQLARIKLSRQEEKKYTETISVVLDYMKILDEVDINNLEPTSQVTGLCNIVRDDSVRPCDHVDELIKQLPVTENSRLKISGVFEPSNDV